MGGGFAAAKWAKARPLSSSVGEGTKGTFEAIGLFPTGMVEKL
jgi:hypothetical protein